LNSSATGQLNGTYSTPSGETGNFMVYYPDPNDKKTINIRVTASIGGKDSTVTTVIRGTPLDIEDYISDYNVYITAPHAGYTYDLQKMYGSDGPLTLYISTTETNYTFYRTGKFPQFTSTGSQVTVSGDIIIRL
jgi:hypothetical protein